MCVVFVLQTPPARPRPSPVPAGAVCPAAGAVTDTTTALTTATRGTAPPGSPAPAQTASSPAPTSAACPTPGSVTQIMTVGTALTRPAAVSVPHRPALCRNTHTHSFRVKPYFQMSVCGFQKSALLRLLKSAWRLTKSVLK